MYKEEFKSFGLLFIFLGLVVIFFVRPFIMGISGVKISYGIEVLLFVLSLIFFWLSTFAKSRKDESWICETCNVRLVRGQIKFGVCPYCSKKVKGFRGLQYHDRYCEF